MNVQFVWRTTAALALSSALSTSATAEPLFDYGAISVTATRYLFTQVTEQQTDIAPAGNPALASVLAHPLGIARFPTSESALPLGFVSATMTGTGFGGVGVSFISAGTPDYAAIAVWEQDITNVGNVAAPLEAHFDIPRLEASLMAGPLYGPFYSLEGPYAFAGARLKTTRFAEDGSKLAERTVFDYYLSIKWQDQGDDCDQINDIVISNDLDARLPHPQGIRVIEEHNVCGVASAPFAGSVSLGVLGAGERLLVHYELIAENLASASFTPELGYQALAGDPFGVSGGGGIRVTAGAAAVPEPQSVVLLLIGGLAALCAALMRRTS